MSTAEFIAWGLGLMAERFDGHRDELRAIQPLIDSDESLQERSLRKREMLNSLLDAALRGRGLGERQARLLAEATVSALSVALDQWRNSDTDVSIDVLALKALAGLHADLDSIGTVQRPAAEPGRPSP
jgi:hypothetical protein